MACFVNLPESLKLSGKLYSCSFRPQLNHLSLEGVYHMKRVSLSFIVLLLLAATSNSQSSTPEFATDHKGSLRNVRRFGVLVEDINTNTKIERYIPTKDQLRIDTELKLRKIGVYVPNPDEIRHAYLYIYINICRAGNWTAPLE